MHTTIPATVLSTAITLALFYAMQSLIALQPGALVPVRDYDELGWVRLPEPKTTLKDDLWEKPEPVTPPPIIPPTGRTTSTDTFTAGVPVEPPPPRPDPDTRRIGFMADGPLVTVLNVQPVYPVRAIQRGLEGYVIVSLDVEADGSVGGVRVVESSHTVFESSAIDAARRCRFKPRVVNGVPQAVTGLQKMFRYELDH